uniref:Sugar phosphate transporter domain-containing protein n=1 Tax=Oryza punctata TaxID=4537 RepID=A0A0E0JQE7_ORYPU
MVDVRMAGTAAALGLSVVSSVSIVVCNKALMSTLGFVFAVSSEPCSSAAGGRGADRSPPPFTYSTARSSPRSTGDLRLVHAYLATTLTSWHLLVTFCSLHVALQMKLFENKDLDPKIIIGFGILNGISIGLLNLSLGFNSIGFYQVTKLAIIPCTVSLETIFFRKTFSRSIQMALAILLFGVGVATVTDLQLNRLGSLLSLWRNIFGILLALLGMILYSYFCLMENQQKAPELPAPFFHTKVKGGEAGTLLLVQNGSAKVADGVVTEGPIWRSNRDLDA